MTSPNLRDAVQALRTACENIRRKSMPLADLIPLMQRAADAIESSTSLPSEASAQQAAPSWLDAPCPCGYKTNGYCAANACVDAQQAAPSGPTLTDEEIDDVWRQSEGYRPGQIAGRHAIDFARAIESAVLARIDALGGRESHG